MNRFRSKSIIAIILSFVMVMTITPAAVFADDDGGVSSQKIYGIQQEMTAKGDESAEPVTALEGTKGLPALGERWDAFKITATLTENNGVGGTASYYVTVKNTTSKKLTLSWMYSWYYKTIDATGVPFGKIYSGGSVIPNDGKGITFAAGQTRTYEVKGKVPTSWINGKSHITIVAGVESLQYYGQADLYTKFGGSNPTQPQPVPQPQPTPTPTPQPTPPAADSTKPVAPKSGTSTDFRIFKTKAAYVFQAPLWPSTDLGYMIRNNMNESLSHAIPGLRITDIGKDVKTYIPQGLCKFTYEGSTYYLITAYDEKEEHNSVLYVLNSKWEFVKNLTLPNNYHNGGIAYDSKADVVWFTGNTNGDREDKNHYVYCMEGSKLGKRIKGSYTSIPSFDENHTKQIKNAASCLDYYDGRLWVGSFGENSSKIIGYKTSGINLSNKNTISVSGLKEKLNGFTFGNSNDIYLSYSKGRYFYGVSMIEHVGYSVKPQAGKPLQLNICYGISEVPKMNEEILLSGNYLYVLYESAATKYIYSAYVITDRITAINKSVWDNNRSVANTAKGSENAMQIQEAENIEISFEYNEAAEINNKEKKLSFTPGETGTYNISVELLDEGQNFYVLGGVLDTDTKEEGMLITEFSTVKNVYDEEEVGAEYLNHESVDLNLTAGHTYEIGLYATAANEAEGNKNYSGTYRVNVTRTGEINKTAVQEGVETEETVSAGNSSCFEITPAETGTYIIEWESSGELAGNTITDSNDNEIELKDNYCDLEAGETYYFSSTVLEGEGTSQAASVHFACDKMDEKQLAPDAEISVSNDTMLTYHAETSDRHIVKCSYESDGMTISAYDSEGNLVGLGGDSMVFSTEAGADYRISCTGVSEEAVLTVEPYIADINTTKVTLTKELKYSKSLKAPVPTIYEDQNKLVRGTDYTLSYDGIKMTGSKAPAKARNVGKHKVTITGIGKYKGSVTVTYTIKPAGTSVSKLSSYKKALKVYWKKQSLKMASTRISGYQVQVATNKAFSSNKKTVTVKGYSKTSYKVTKLKAKRTYYARVRTYKTVNGVKYYSAWSTAKKLKTK